jgi:hypothetical protein
VIVVGHRDDARHIGAARRTEQFLGGYVCGQRERVGLSSPLCLVAKRGQKRKRGVFSIGLVGKRETVGSVRRQTRVLFLVEKESSVCGEGAGARSASWAFREGLER